MKVLITGGTGFLGRHAAVRLASLGHAVSILGRNAASAEPLVRRGIRFIQTDLADETKVTEACRGRDQVIHCGGLASPWGDYNSFYRANVLGTQHVVQGCFEHAVQRLIHLSTPSLYFDYRDRLNIKESDPLPRKFATHYAATKRIADTEVERAASEGLSVISLRPRAIFGPGDKTVLGRILKMGEKGRVPLVGGGKSFVDMTYVENVVDAILLCMDAPESMSGRTFNITNGEPMTAREMMTKFFGALSMEVEFKSIPFGVAYMLGASTELFYKWFRRGVEPPLTRYALGLMGKSQTLDISLAQTELGYQPKISVGEGMTRFVRWWRDHEDEFAVS